MTLDIASINWLAVVVAVAQDQRVFETRRVADHHDLRSRKPDELSLG
jgi:hypothetical protein